MVLFFDKFSEISQGCDGSVLLEGSTSEQNARPNLSLRKEALKFVDDLRARVHKECGRVVSCADILALAARDSVALVYIYLHFFFHSFCFSSLKSGLLTNEQNNVIV